MGKKYQRRIPAYNAEQFHTAAAWPPGVDDCGDIPGPHLHIPPLTVLPMFDGDWVLYDVRTNAPMRVDDTTFQNDYELHTGPTGDLLDGNESTERV